MLRVEGLAPLQAVLIGEKNLHTDAPLRCALILIYLENPYSQFHVFSVVYQVRLVPTSMDHGWADLPLFP